MSEITTGRENGRQRPKGYYDWNPHKKVRARIEQVQSVLDEYDEHLPLTVRQIFYRLVASFGYEKTENAYKRLSDSLVYARRARMIPFSSIRDDGIVTYSPDWYDGVEDFWNETGRRIKNYRRDRQQGQAHRIELWCEAAGMAPQLAQVADSYSVPVFSAGGFSSLSAVRSIVERARRQHGPTVLLHVGDFDPSGESIFEAMVADVSAFLEEDRLLHLQRIIPQRVALTAEQVEEYELQTAPPKASDSRSASWTGETCQLEALAPDELAVIVDDTISDWFDIDTLEQQVRRESAEVDQLIRALPRGDS